MNKQQSFSLKLFFVFTFIFLCLLSPIIILGIESELISEEDEIIKLISKTDSKMQDINNLMSKAKIDIKNLKQNITNYKEKAK